MSQRPNNLFFQRVQVFETGMSQSAPAPISVSQRYSFYSLYVREHDPKVKEAECLRAEAITDLVSAARTCKRERTAFTLDVKPRRENESHEVVLGGFNIMAIFDWCQITLPTRVSAMRENPVRYYPLRVLVGSLHELLTITMEIEPTNVLLWSVSSASLFEGSPKVSNRLEANIPGVPTEVFQLPYFLS